VFDEEVRSFFLALEVASSRCARRRGGAIGPSRIHRQGGGPGRGGGLLSYAALIFERQKAPGLDGALHAIMAQTFGRFLLTAVALGFVAFGLFALLQSRYRRM
jgi:hypothetical protein